MASLVPVRPFLFVMETDERAITQCTRDSSGVFPVTVPGRHHIYLDFRVCSYLCFLRVHYTTVKGLVRKDKGFGRLASSWRQSKSMGKVCVCVCA